MKGERDNDMAKLADLIALRSRLIRRFNKLSDDEFNELEDGVFILASDAADMFRERYGRTLEAWGIQALDWMTPGLRALHLLKPGEHWDRNTGADLEAQWRERRPKYQASFTNVAAWLKARADASRRGERVPDHLPRQTRTTMLAEFMVLAWGPR
jgi:hypothetical protein